MTDYSPELIPSCKETQLIRFQSKVEALVPPARRHSMRIINLALLVMCILSGLAGLAYLGFDPLVRSIVLKKLVLSNTSETFHIWEDPPISPHFKVYFFNLSNPEEVFSGKEKPHLVEIGPYTYKQKWLKQNVTWHSNGTISYKTRKIFTYSPEDSCAGCSDTSDNITTLNVPAITAYFMNRDASWYNPIVPALNWGLGLGYKPYLTRPVFEMMWGYDEPLFSMAQFLPNPPPFQKFGLFLQRNASEESQLGEYSMYTGEGDPYRLATIHSYNNKKEMGFWNESRCNKVHGSDGASFNPYIKKEDTLWFFNDQLCRALPLVYDRTVDQDGLPGLRFVPREDVFMSSKSYPQNACYERENSLVGDGIFDVTVCQFDAPIILSWPHFLGAEQRFSQAVTGLSPDKEKHGFWFDIQEVTGTTLSAKARFQINMMVPKLDIYTDLSKINSTMVVPILWMEEGIDELGPDLVGVLKQAVIDPQNWRHYILLVFLGLVITLMLLSVVALFRCILNRTKVERVREQVENMIHNQLQHENNSQLIQPMLGGLDSSDSSRCTTATHSRTSSEGVTPAYAVVNQAVNVNPAPSGLERPTSLLPTSVSTFKPANSSEGIV